METSRDDPNEAAMEFRFLCPRDRTALRAVEGDKYLCPACSGEYPVSDGVLRMLPATDKFYEGAYENQVAFTPKSEQLRHAWPLWLINSGFLWGVRNHVAAGSRVVELGCAGGVRYFGQRYHMVGCDVSFSSLKKLGAIYEHRIQADASVCLPLPDSSVDAVISSYFWEHVTPEIKPKILAECARILRPGGHLIFLYDVETRNPLIAHYRRVDESAYRRLFIDGDGHWGYQSPRDNLALFSDGGFDVLEHRGMEKTPLQSPSAFAKLAEFTGTSRIAFAWTSMLGRAPISFMYAALVRIVDTVLCPLLPSEWARIDLVVCRKRRGPDGDDEQVRSWQSRKTTSRY